MSTTETVNVKLTGAKRFACPQYNPRKAVVRNEVINVTPAMADYFTSLTKKDRSNNEHQLFVVTDEEATSISAEGMSEKQKFAKAVREEAEGKVAEAEAEDKPAPKRRAKKAAGTRGTRNASKVVA